MNHSTPTCAACGAPLGPETPQGICPRCLLRAGLATCDPPPLHIRCPHCHNPIELLDEQPLRDITCPSCDTCFNIADDATITFDPQRSNKLGRFELLQQVGVGAFGAVWKARDPLLDRIVALKIPRQGQLAASEVERFLREARSAARLAHPNIVTVHEIGIENDTVHIVSDFIAGVTLADRIASARPSISESVRLCETIARALAHAHAAGVVHRDLKPSNILLDERGHPYLTDFGLAKRDAAEITMTLEGQVLGTPAYMSPEQAQGERNKTDGRTDVYSLGVMLFELLTGERPFRGNTRMLLQQVVHDEPPSPRALNARIPRDLETICLKCLEKDPRGRYASAESLADDLARFVRSEPIQARPIRTIERWWRWAQRNPLPASLAAGLVLVLLGGLAGVTWQWRRAVEQRRLAVEREQESRQRLVRQYVSDGAEALERGQPLEALVWFAEASRRDRPEAEFQEAHRRRLGTVGKQLPRLLHVLPHDKAVQARYSSDGRRIATYSGSTFRLWDAESGEPLVDPIDQAYHLWTVEFSGDSRYVAAITNPLHPPSNRNYSGTITVYDAADGRAVLPRLDVPRLEAWQVRFTPDSKRLLVGTEKSVRVVDVATGRDVYPPLEHRLPTRWLACDPRGRRLLVNRGVVEGENEIQLFDLHSGAIVGAPLSDHEFGEDNPFSEDSRHYVTYSVDDTGGRGDGPATVQVWDSETAASVRSLTTPRAVRKAFLLGRTAPPTIAAWLNDERLYLNPPSTDDELQQWLPPLWTLAVAPDGMRIAAQRSDSREVVIVGRESLGSTQAVFSVARAVTQLAFSPDGQRLAVCARGRETRRGEVHVIDIESKEQVCLEVPHQYGELSAQFSPDGRRLLVGDEEGIARVWDLTTMGSTLRKCATLNDRGVSAIELSPSEKWLAIGQGHDDLQVDRGGGEPFGLLQAWDLETGEPVGPEVRFKTRVTAVRFAPNEKRALATLSDGSVEMVDVVSGRSLGVISGFDSQAITLATFDEQGQITLLWTPRPLGESPTPIRGARIERRVDFEQPVSSIYEVSEHVFLKMSRDGTRHLLIRPNREADIFVRYPSAHEYTRRALGRMHGDVRDAVFSPDGNYVALVFADEVAEIWELEHARISARLIRGVEVAEFSADGKRLLTGKGGVFRIWDARTGEPLSGPIPAGTAISPPKLAATPVFGPHADCLLTTAGDRLRVWDLRPDNRPLGDLVKWSHLLSGHRVDELGSYALASADRLRTAWREYRASYPADLRAPSQAVVLAWHEREAWQSEFLLSRDNAYEDHRRTLAWAAHSHLDALIAREPSASRFSRRGTVALALGTLDAAVKDFTQAIDGGLGDDRVLRLRRGRALDLRGDHDAAHADVKFAFQRGQLELLDQPARWEKLAAIEGLTERLAKDEDNVEALELRARLEWDVEQYEAGLRDLDRLIVAGRKSWFIVPHRADCLAGLGRYHEAIETCTAALGPLADDPDLLEQRAACHAMAGQFDAALSDLRKARTLVSYTLKILLQEAVVRLLADDMTGYRANCEEALQFLRHSFGFTSDPRRVDPQIAAEAARICLLAPSAVDDLDAIVALAQKGSHNEPRSGFATHTLALAHLRHDEPAETLRVLTESSRRHPLNVYATTIKALALSHQGDKAGASEWLQRAEEQFAEHPRLPLSDRLLAQVLLQEARQTIGAAPAKSD